MLVRTCADTALSPVIHAPSKTIIRVPHSDPQGVGKVHQRRLVANRGIDAGCEG